MSTPNRGEPAAIEPASLPLHQQSLAWGMRKNVTVVQLPDNFNFYTGAGASA